MSASTSSRDPRSTRRPAIAPAVVRRAGDATTAQLLAGAPRGLAALPPERSDEPLSDREQVLAALGFALHHLTEPLGAAVSMLDMHRATTVLTKQIATALGADGAVADVARLLTDPQRVAMVDGRTALELCGPTWHYVASTSGERVDAALSGVDRFGPRVVARLAYLRGLQANGPWWGTTTWAEHAERWFDEHRLAPRLRSALLRRPERVDDAIVADILNRALATESDVGAADPIRHAG
ncbi:MAG: hypothetical protein HKN41_02750 [Ilumatobacter sp.]|nr:hypothetical protein [Ilumatobacter sp.]